MRIAYILHRFPVRTDTFIRREIRCLQSAGMDVSVVSIWRPVGEETTIELLREWAQVCFVLPNSALSVVKALCRTILMSPRRTVRALRLAVPLSRPGLRGAIYQLFYFTEAALAASALRSQNIDHIHNHFGDQSGTVAMLAAALLEVDYSISFHGPHIFFDAQNSALREKIRRARFIRCISYYCRSQLMVVAAKSKLPPLSIVHCGLEVERYHFREPRRDVARLFCAARLAPEKGIEFLIKALSLLTKMHPNLYLRLAGDGPSRDALMVAARKLGVGDRIFFLGNLSDKEITCELETADLFVLPSLAEGVPVSVMEAMAVGVPVVATNIAGTSELVEDGRTGLLVRPCDPDALVHAIDMMIRDYEFRVTAARLGRAKVEDEFDVRREVPKLIADFEVRVREAAR